MLKDFKDAFGLGDECCGNCRNMLEIERWNYAEPGVPKEKLEGYICLAHASEGTAIHMVGLNPARENCEMFVQTQEPPSLAEY